MASSDKLGTKATEEWQSNDLEESRRDALMAQIKLKTALALMEQDQLRKKLETLSSDSARAEEQFADVAKELAHETESLDLLQKYIEARQAAESEKMKLSQQMTSEQEKAQAEQQRLSQQLASEQKIAAAQLSLRTADTVDAGRYAKAEFSAAADSATSSVDFPLLSVCPTTCTG